MKVLITGASGYIGGQLMAELYGKVELSCLVFFFLSLNCKRYLFFQKIIPLADFII